MISPRPASANIWLAFNCSIDFHVFNSNADYNVLFAEKDGTQAHAQIKAFEDTWMWDLEAAQEYAEVLRSGHDRVAALAYAEDWDMIGKLSKR